MNLFNDRERIINIEYNIEKITENGHKIIYEYCQSQSRSRGWGRGWSQSPK